MIDRSPLLFRRVTDRAEIERGIKLRTHTFEVELQFPVGADVDEHDDDPTTVHVVVYAQEDDDKGPHRIIGVARCVPDLHNQVGRIGRVSIVPELRGRGIGHRLMEFLEHTVVAEVIEIERFRLHALLDRRSFYERCGYVATSQIFLEKGIPMIAMDKPVGSRNDGAGRKATPP